MEDCKVAGVLAHGDGSRADVEGGSITRAQSSHAAACQEGAWMRLTDVAISDCPGGAGVISYGVGSQVVVEGGSIRGCACNDVIEREGATATSSGVQIG